jgi:hypothetical protein
VLGLIRLAVRKPALLKFKTRAIRWRGWPFYVRAAFPVRPSALRAMLHLR